MDLPTIKLADSYDTLQKVAEKATKAKVAAVEAEKARSAKAFEEIQGLVDAESKALQAVAKAGQARVALMRAIPSDVAINLENAQSELRQHTSALEGAQRILKTQLAHHAKVMETIERYPEEMDPVTNKLRPSSRALYEKKEIDAGLAKAKAGLDEENKRCDALKATIAKHEKTRDEFFKELRARAK